MYTVPLFDDEALTSYCARLAAANAKTATDFCLDMGLQFQAVIDGSEPAILMLADHGKVAAGRLRKAAVKETVEGLDIDGEIFTRRNFTRTRLRICPRCFRDDDNSKDRLPGTRRYIRRLWPLRFLRTCPVHNCRIIDLGTAPLYSPRNHDFIECLDGMFDAVQEAMHDERGRNLSDFEKFLLGRLDGCRRDGELLDEMSLSSGAYLCELAGSVKLYGTKTLEKNLDEAQLWEAGKEGYELLREGIPGLHRFLDTMHARQEILRPDTGGGKLYGRLYHVLRAKDDPSWEKVKQEIRNYTFKVLPLSRAADVFGTRESSEYLLDRDLEEITDIRPGHIRKMAIARGLLDPSMITGGVIPKDVAYETIRLLGDWLLPMEAAKLLGMTYPNFARFRQAGMFIPDLASGNGVVIMERHSRKAIDGYLSLMRLRVTISTGTVGLKPILATAKSVGCKITEIIELVQAGRLQMVAWDDAKVGLAALLVDPTEVSESLAVRESDDLSVRELSKSWKMSMEAINALIDNGALKTKDRPGVRWRGVQQFISPADAQAFSRKYVTFLNAAIDFNVTRTRVREAVMRANLCPLFPYEEVRALFYDRGDLKEALRAIENEVLPHERRKSLDALRKRD